MENAPDTFSTRRDAERWLARRQAELTLGLWRDPSTGSESLSDYLHAWLVIHHNLRASTLALNTRLAERFIMHTEADLGFGSSSLGDQPLRQITPIMIRRWHSWVVSTSRAGALAKKAPAAVGSRSGNHHVLWPAERVYLPNMRPRPTPARVASLLQDRLPEDWRAIALQSREPRPEGPDLVLKINGPDRDSAGYLVCEFKASVTPRDIPQVADRLSRQAARFDSSQRVLVSTYLSQNVQDALVGSGLGYIDLTGNMRISLGIPGLFLSDRGRDSDPWRGPGRPRESLRGEAAARIVRALVDFSPPMRVRELVALSGSSTGAVYRAIEYLEAQALAARDEQRRIVDVKWPQLLRSWSRDYQFMETNRVTTWLAPRGVDKLVTAIAALVDAPTYAITGSLAAAVWAPYAPARLASIYVDDGDDFANRCGLRPVSSGANVVLAQPAYSVVYERLMAPDVLRGAKVTAPSQVAVDLLTGPGRNPAEGEALIEWMENNERSWRR